MIQRLGTMFLMCFIISQSNAGSVLERVTFDNLQDGTKLTAFYSQPETKGPHPAVVMLHGCNGVGSGGILGGHYLSWILHLNQNGFVTLVIDSLTPRGMRTSCRNSGSRQKLFRVRPADAYAGLKYLKSKSDVAPNRIGLIGWSQGGAITLFTIVENSIGRPDPPPKHDFKTAIAFYPSACSDRQQSKPYTNVELGTWKPIAPVQIFHGAKDTVTLPGPCRRFVQGAKKRGEPIGIKIYPNAVHSFDVPNMPLRYWANSKLPKDKQPLVGTAYQARRDVLRQVVVILERTLRK